ncbi:hypothetical protein Pmani_031029 [Petrolisthes manimaculis]|uniref:Uncharacterized protein n=1 Tax=Petrolisthes manimaculis TaxID=1843537 RepID=A0AAE1TVA8_9EUCA|nr:hypothetical protein Pmani_031029 [Petrolisthes manimaculis]
MQSIIWEADHIPAVYGSGVNSCWCISEHHADPHHATLTHPATLTPPSTSTAFPHPATLTPPPPPPSLTSSIKSFVQASAHKDA